MVSKKPKSVRAQMREAIDARATLGRHGHFYVNPRSIEVYGCALRSGEATAVRITKAQLEAALALMEKV